MQRWIHVWLIETLEQPNLQPHRCNLWVAYLGISRRWEWFYETRTWVVRCSQLLGLQWALLHHNGFSCLFNVSTAMASLASWWRVYMEAHPYSRLTQFSIYVTSVLYKAVAFQAQPVQFTRFIYIDTWDSNEDKASDSYHTIHTTNLFVVYEPVCTTETNFYVSWQFWNSDGGTRTLDLVVDRVASLFTCSTNCACWRLYCWFFYKYFNLPFYITQ